MIEKSHFPALIYVSFFLFKFKYSESKQIMYTLQKIGSTLFMKKTIILFEEKVKNHREQTTTLFLSVLFFNKPLLQFLHNFL